MHITEVPEAEEGAVTVQTLFPALFFDLTYRWCKIHLHARPGLGKNLQVRDNINLEF